MLKKATELFRWRNRKTGSLQTPPIGADAQRHAQLGGQDGGAILLAELPAGSDHIYDKDAQKKNGGTACSKTTNTALPDITLSNEEERVFRRQKMIWLLFMFVTQLSWFSTIAALILFIIKFGTSQSPGFLIWFLLSLGVSFAASVALWVLWDQRRIRRRIERLWLEVDSQRLRDNARDRGGLAERSGEATEQSVKQATRDDDIVAGKKLGADSIVNYFQPSGDLYKIGQPKAPKASFDRPSKVSQYNQPHRALRALPIRASTEEEEAQATANGKVGVDTTRETEEPGSIVTEPGYSRTAMSPVSMPEIGGCISSEGKGIVQSPVERIVLPLERQGRAMSPVERVISPLARLTASFERARSPVERFISPSGQISYIPLAELRRDDCHVGMTQGGMNKGQVHPTKSSVEYLRGMTASQDSFQRYGHNGSISVEHLREKSESSLRGLKYSIDTTLRASFLEDEIMSALDDAQSSRHGSPPPVNRLHQRSDTALTFKSLPMLAELPGSPVEQPATFHGASMSSQGPSMGMIAQFPSRRSPLPPETRDGVIQEQKPTPVPSLPPMWQQNSPSQGRPTTMQADDGWSSFSRFNIPPYPTVAVESNLGLGTPIYRAVELDAQSPRQVTEAEADIDEDSEVVIEDPHAILAATGTSPPGKFSETTDKIANEAPSQHPSYGMEVSASAARHASTLPFLSGCPAMGTDCQLSDFENSDNMALVHMPITDHGSQESAQVQQQWELHQKEMGVNQWLSNLATNPNPSSSDEHETKPAAGTPEHESKQEGGRIPFQGG